MKADLDQLVREIEEVLAAELPEKYRGILREFESFVAEEEFRGAFATLDRACRLPDWHPSTRLLGLREKFMVVF